MSTVVLESDTGHVGTRNVEFFKGDTEVCEASSFSVDVLFSDLGLVTESKTKSSTRRNPKLDLATCGDLTVSPVTASTSRLIVLTHCVSELDIEGEESSAWVLSASPHFESTLLVGREVGDLDGGVVAVEVTSTELNWVWWMTVISIDKSEDWECVLKEEFSLVCAWATYSVDGKFTPIASFDAEFGDVVTDEWCVTYASTID